jgi:sulfoxide reductase heme-binding subunit YedZ
VILLTAAADARVYWFLTRSTGVVSLVLLTTSVLLGLLGTLRVSGRRWPRYAIEAVHRDVSLLVLAVLAVHIVTTVLDSFAPINITAAVIPFISSYRPVWLGLGALAFDLLLAVAITSLVRRRLGYARWRAAHWLAYASWPIAVLHGLGAGSDTRLWWMLALTAACTAAVAAAVCVRLARAERRLRGIRGPGLAACAGVVVGLAVFTIAGPLQRGWARRSGTPSRLLAHPAAQVTRARLTPAHGGSTPAGSARAAAGRSATATVRGFTADLRGRMTQRSVTGGAIVDLALRLSGGAAGRLRVRIGGTPLAGGGLSMTGSQVDLLLRGDPAVFAGTIRALQGTAFLARVRSAAGAALTLRGELSIDQRTDAVSGRVTGVR